MAVVLVPAGGCCGCGGSGPGSRTVGERAVGCVHCGQGPPRRLRFTLHDWAGEPPFAAWLNTLVLDADAVFGAPYWTWAVAAASAPYGASFTFRCDSRGAENPPPLDEAVGSVRLASGFLNGPVLSDGILPDEVDTFSPVCDVLGLVSQTWRVRGTEAAGFVTATEAPE